ncbi:hypothetical protein Lal_00039628 [Lupinus albus]|nr:hypothetical protein Lal_00039628 [Lupinus albus]
MPHEEHKPDEGAVKGWRQGFETGGLSSSESSSFVTPRRSRKKLGRRDGQSYLLLWARLLKKRLFKASFHFMVKHSFIPIISEEKKKEENPGSVEFQVVNFTNKIRRLTSHLELHRKDYLSQRGLRKILGNRQRLLSYLSKKNGIRYKKLIKQLGIRESQIR